MDYFLKANGLVILLILFYYLFLGNETFFNSIRVYFLAGLSFIISVPLIEIPIYVEKTVSNINWHLIEGSSTNNIPVDQGFDWLQLLTLLYLGGAVFFSIKFIVQLFSLGKLLTKHKIIQHGKYKLVETYENTSPFSFFNCIVYNKSLFAEDELKQIITHEKTHVKQWHSIDTLLANILQIVFWFNPFAWFYKKAVQQNLEFLADASVSKQTDNQKQYQITLLKACNSNFSGAITNNFYNSLIKKRIIMLQKNKSKKRMQWKYALLLPFLLAFIFAFNTKTIAQEKELIEVVEIKTGLIINKNSTDASLKEGSDYFKSEFDISLTFKGIKRNSNNEITAIKITAKGDHLKTKFENSSNKAIKPIKISYDSNNDSLNISNISKPKSHYSYTIHSDEGQEHNGTKKVKYIMVTSDGNKKTRTSKFTDTIIQSDTIFYKDTDINKVKVIGYYNDNISGRTDTLKGNITGNITYTSEAKYNDDISGRADTLKGNIKMILGKDFDIDEDNASENIFIVKKDGKLIQKKSGHSMMAFSTNSDKEKPLFIVNGNEISMEAVNKIPPEDIYSISVIKNEDAIKTYGVKGENGVVNITLKTDKKSPKVLIGQPLSNSPRPSLIIKDGKEISQEEMEKINPEDIKSMEVLKGDKAVKKYGKKAKDGVVIITLKKE